MRVTLDAAPPTPFRLAVARHGYTVRQLAKVLGCSHTHLSRVLAGERALADPARARLLGLGFHEHELATEVLAPEQAAAVAVADAVVLARRQQGLPDYPSPEVVTAIARVLAKALINAEAEAVGQ